MTMPSERYRAVVNTREFLIRLATPSDTPRVPSGLRQEARSLLRHYPGTLDMEEAASGAPSVFAGVTARQRDAQAFMVEAAERLTPPKLSWWELLFGTGRSDGRNEPAEG